jgi:hypothetical protein
MIIMQRAIVIFFVLFLFNAALTKAQSLTPTVINSGGVSAANGDYYLTGTIGEVAIETHSRIEATVIQGFQQPLIDLGVFVFEPGQDYEIRIFPNPTLQILNIDIKGLQDKMRLRIYDLIGHLLLEKQLETEIQKVDIGNLASGAFILKLSDKNNRLVGVWRVLKL